MENLLPKFNFDPHFFLQSLHYAMHDRANTPVRPYKQTRGALNTHIPLSPWICNPRVLRQGFINPL